MSEKKRTAILIVCILLFPACSTHAPKVTRPHQETPHEQVDALQGVVGSVSGQEVSEQDLRDLMRNVNRDEETRSAVEALSGAMSGRSVTSKYCPVTGKRYSPAFTICPEHNVPLRSSNEDAD